MATKLGINARLYVSDTPTTAATEAAVETALTTSDLLGAVRTVTQNLQKDRQDITSRANNGYKQYASGLKDGTIEFEANSTTDDADVFQILVDAYFDDSEIAVAALDGVIGITGSSGLAGNYTVTNLTRNEPIDGAISFNVQLSPSSNIFYYKAS